jgi:hypothetical protein
MNGPRVFWPSGGDIVSTHGRLIAPVEAERLRALYLYEASASAGDHRTRDEALRLADELRQALETAARWRCAAAATYEAGGARPPRLTRLAAWRAWRRTPRAN